jgi:hypothetical protein
MIKKDDWFRASVVNRNNHRHIKVKIGPTGHRPAQRTGTKAVGFGAVQQSVAFNITSLVIPGGFEIPDPDDFVVRHPVPVDVIACENGYMAGMGE